MPAARLIDIPTRRSRTRQVSESVRQQRAQAQDLIQQARATGKVIELALDPDERDETIKMHFRAVAKEIRATIRFQTARQRPYRNRAGREEYEAEVLLVLVTPEEPAPPSRQPRRRRASAGA